MAVAQSKYLIEIELVDGKAQARLNGVSVSLGEVDKQLKNVRKSTTETTTATKQLTEAQKKQVDKSGLAGATLVELGRTISDLPFGITAITNNLSQLATLFTTLIASTGGVGNAFQILSRQIRGPLGIILGFQVAIALLEVFAQRLRRTKKESDDLTKSFEKFSMQAGATIAELELLLGVIQNNSTGALDFDRALSQLEKNFPLLVKQLKVAGVTTEDLKNKTNEARRITDQFTQSILRQARARAIFNRLQEIEGLLIQEEIKLKLDLEDLEEQRVQSISARNRKLSRDGAVFTESVEELAERQNEASRKRVKQRQEEFDDETEKLEQEKQILLEKLNTSEVLERFEIKGLDVRIKSVGIKELEIDADNLLTETNTKNTNVRIENSDKELRVRLRNLSLLSRYLKSGADAFGEQTVANKAINVSAATIDAYVAFNRVLAEFRGSPVLRTIAAAAVLATGLANVKKILAVKIPGKSDRASSAGAGGAGGNVFQAPDFNIVGASAQSQLAQTIAGAEAKPVRAFVVGKDITTQQELDRNTTRTASFG